MNIIAIVLSIAEAVVAVVVVAIVVVVVVEQAYLYSVVPHGAVNGLVVGEGRGIVAPLQDLAAPM